MPTEEPDGYPENKECQQDHGQRSNRGGEAKVQPHPLEVVAMHDDLGAMDFPGDELRGLDIDRGSQGHRTSFPNDGGAPSPASQVLVGVHGRAATRIRASRERSGPCFRCADDEGVTRKRDLHVLAVMTSALAQCTPWQRETNQDSTWVGHHGRPLSTIEQDLVRRSGRFANDVLHASAVYIGGRGHCITVSSAGRKPRWL